MSDTKFLPIDVVATRLGLPLAWLDREIKGGRIPFLRAGRRRLLDIEVVKAVLRSQAEETAVATGGRADG